MSRTYSAQEVQEQFGAVCDWLERLQEQVDKLKDEVEALQEGANG